MNDEVNGYIYFDARVLLTEVNFDKSKVKHGGMYIRFDNLLTHFDLDTDAHSLPELYAQTQLNVERYADEIAGQIWEFVIRYSKFDDLFQTALMTSTIFW